MSDFIFVEVDRNSGPKIGDIITFAEVTRITKNFNSNTVSLDCRRPTRQVLDGGDARATNNDIIDGGDATTDYTNLNIISGEDATHNGYIHI